MDECHTGHEVKMNNFEQEIHEQAKNTELEYGWRQPSKLIDMQYKEMLLEICVLRSEVKRLKDENDELSNKYLVAVESLSARTLQMALHGCLAPPNSPEAVAMGYKTKE